MNEQRNNGRGIFYGVIGVATLVVAIIGATFAYFTATGSAGENVIKGNMATITFNVAVEKVTTVDETKGGMIPMSNSMVEAAVSNASGACLDANGNAVCQVYKVTVTNTGTASLFLDGYTTLTDSTGVTPTDAGGADSVDNKTVMRWAQVFEDDGSYSTGGSTTTGMTGVTAFDTLDAKTAADSTGKNNDNIKTAWADVKGTGSLNNSSYDVIGRNYIRISNHTDGATYARDTDVTSGLVYNQYLAPSGQTGNTVDIYFVVWLSETGTNQNPADAEAALNFFGGKVTFVSGTGSEVTATFSSYSRVTKTP